MTYGQTSPYLGWTMLSAAGRKGNSLAAANHKRHIAAMISRDQWRGFIDHPVVEWSIFGVGVILILLSPLAGAIPGPGGIFVFALGLAMVLKTSMWAKRRYVRFKRKQPRFGHWADWGLRRRSALRRERLRREREREEAAEALEGGATPAAIGQAPPQPAAPIETPPESASDPQRRAD